MNVNLIQHNIGILSDFVEKENTTEAVKTAFGIARLLLQSPAQAASRELYIAYSGTVASMKACLDTLLAAYSPTEDIAQMVQRIRELCGEFEKSAAEYEDLTVREQELLKKKKELDDQQKALLELKAEIERLISLKDQEIPALNDEIASLELTLKELKASAEIALAERRKWQAVFDENLRLIGDLPESVRDKNADQIISAAKDYALKAAQACDDGDDWLRKVIDAVEQAKEWMKQSSAQG